MTESEKKKGDSSKRIAEDLIEKARRTTATKRTDPPSTPQPKPKPKPKE